MASTIDLGKRCKISRKLPGACVDDGFRRSCDAFRKTVGMRFGFSVECPGEWPDVSKQSVKGETDMGINKRYKNEICESCGKEKTVGMHFGKKVCSMCTAMRVTVRKHPESVFAALHEFNKMPGAVCAADVDSTIAENAELREEVASLKKDISTYMAVVKEYKERKDLAANADEIIRLRERNAELVEQVEELTKSRDLLLTARPTPLPLSEAKTGKLRDLAWKLADGVLGGTITGVSVDDIKTLREAA